VRRHQYFFADLAATSRGVNESFFVGCHSRAAPGATEASELVIDARQPA